jgi:hypothetical protein
MTIWKQPPIIKVYEALGSIADGRIRAQKPNLHLVINFPGKIHLVEDGQDGNALVSKTSFGNE